jgi:hypothetical protein
MSIEPHCTNCNFPKYPRLEIKTVLTLRPFIAIPSGDDVCGTCSTGHIYYQEGNRRLPFNAVEVTADMSGSETTLTFKEIKK